MRCDLRSLPAAVLVAVLLSSGASAAEKVPAAKKPAATPLVRTDLLGVSPPEPAAAVRDIFSPGRAVPAPEAVGAPGRSEVPDGEDPGAGSAAETVPEEPAIDLSYIGYVTSRGKMVALVFSEGQALAVVEGEEIIPGVKVAKIGRDRIEVVEPDGKRTSVPIQGEQP